MVLLPVKNISGYPATTASHGGVAYGVSAQAGNGGVAIGMAADSSTRAGNANNPLTNAVAIGRVLVPQWITLLLLVVAQYR